MIWVVPLSRYALTAYRRILESTM